MTGSNKKIQPKQYFFADGSWMPNTDPFVVGDKNFVDIQNFRYRDGYIEVVKGYTDIVTNGIAYSHGGTTYTRVASSGQIVSPFTTTSYILGEVESSSGDGIAILAKTDTIPTGVADFGSTAVFVHGTHVDTGRFASFPQNHIAFCNANGSYVWAGEEMHFGYVGITANDSIFSEYTDQAKNDSATIDESVPLTIMVESDSQGVDDNIFDPANTAGYDKYAVRFKSSRSGKIQSVFFRLKWVHAPGASTSSVLRASIFTSTGTYPSSDLPNTISGSASSDVNVSDLDNDYANYMFTFPTPVDVSEDTYYWIVVETDSYSYSASDYVSIASYDSSEQTDGAAYSDGTWHKHGAANDTLIDFQVFYQVYLYLGSTRPIQGGKVYISAPNAMASSMSVSYWDIDSFATVGSVTDNTASAGVTLAQTGTFSFSSTVDVAQLLFVDERVLYFYRMGFSVPIGSAVKANGHYDVAYAYKITANAEFQPMTNIWSGEYQAPLTVLYYENATAKWYDQTTHIIDDSSSTYTTETPFATPMSGMIWAAADKLYIISTKRCQGFYFHFVPKGNNNTSSRVMTVERYQPGGWVEASFVVDKTDTGSTPWGASGVTWINPDSSDVQTTVHGSPKGYAYRVSFNGTLNPPSGGIGIRIYHIQVLEAPESIKAGYEFPFMFRDRPMLCGYKDGDEGYRVDYGMANTVDIFNGEDSSFGIGKSPLYFGSSGNVNAACELFSMLSSNLYHFAVFTKVNETYILDGYDADTWKIYKMSGVTGCAAPRTMDTAQITTEQGGVKTIAMWVSMTGPVMCDAATITPLKGLEKYFDPNESICVNFDSLDVAVGWYDPQNNEYNILLPSGASQTSNNVWAFYSFSSNRWYRKVPAQYPIHVQRVMDQYGRHYGYGFFSGGDVRRLEYGDTWDGTAISPTVTTGEVLPSGDLWDITRLCRLKLIGRRMTATRTVTVTWYKDSNPTGVALATLDLTGVGSETYIRDIVQVQNRYAYSHALKFSPQFSSGDILPRLYAWSMEYEVEREDIV